MLNAAQGKTATVDTTGGNITLNGAFSGTGSLAKTGTGQLSLGSASADYAGTVTLSSGTLAFPGRGRRLQGRSQHHRRRTQGGQYYSGASKNVTVNAAAGVSSISLGGLNGSSLKSIDITDAGTVISGINGAASLDSANLVVGTDNVAKTQDLAGSDSIIQFNENGATLDIASLTLSLSADVVNAMQGWGSRRTHRMAQPDQRISELRHGHLQPASGRPGLHRHGYQRRLHRYHGRRHADLCGGQ